MMIATGKNNGNNDGDGMTGNEFVRDGRQGRRWRWRDEQRRDRIRRRQWRRRDG
jgi:hypothetical protein